MVLTQPISSEYHHRLANAFQDGRNAVIQAVLLEFIDDHFPFTAGFLLGPCPDSVTAPNISVVRTEHDFPPVLAIFFKVTEDTPSALIRATSYFVEKPSTKFALGIANDKWSLYMRDSDSSPRLCAEGSDWVGEELDVKLDEILATVMEKK